MNKLPCCDNDNGFRRKLNYSIRCVEEPPNTSLGPTTFRNRYVSELVWDGTTLHIRVRGLDDTVDYSQTYTPTGTVNVPLNSGKAISVKSLLELDTTTPVFNWTPVPGARFYRVRIYSDNGNSIFKGYTSAPPYQLPPGILKPYANYKYRIYAIRDHQWFFWNNVSVSDRNRMKFSTDAQEAQTPYIETGSRVATWTASEPFGTNTFFYAKVYDAQGVPGNIESVMATVPEIGGGEQQVHLYFDGNSGSANCGIYRGVYFGLGAAGSYRVTVKSKFRSRWDRGEKTDLLQAGRKLSFSLSDLFPNLSYPVVTALHLSSLDALFDAQLKHLSACDA